MKNQYHYKLFIDELGTASIRDKKSKFYILSGCSIEEKDRLDMKIYADQIKFKYWGHTGIILHSREIGRKEGDFSIFKNKKVYNDFLYDLEKFIQKARFKMFFIVVNKAKAEKLKWNHNKIYKETSEIMVKNFLLSLLPNKSRGKIIIESATAEKDFYFHKAAGLYLSNGIKELKVDFKKIQQTLTSISFVTKNNFDIEEQISDLFAYAAKCKQLARMRKSFKKGKYEKMILKMFNQKIYKTPQNAGRLKNKYFKEINSFVILP